MKKTLNFDETLKLGKIPSCIACNNCVTGRYLNMSCGVIPELKNAWVGIDTNMFEKKCEKFEINKSDLRYLKSFAPIPIKIGQYIYEEE